MASNTMPSTKNITSCPEHINKAFQQLDDPFTSGGDTSAMFSRFANVSKLSDKQALLTSLELDHERTLHIAAASKTVQACQEAYDQAARCVDLQVQTQKDLEFLLKKHMGPFVAKPIPSSPTRAQKR